MAKAKGTTQMADQAYPATATTDAPKKRRAPQGPRTPSPLYAFVKVVDGNKVELAQSFRDPRKMAEYFNTANANGEQLLVISPAS